MLKFNVTGDRLEVISSRSFNSGSKGYYTAEFTFDSDWDGLIPHITITENGTERADEVIVNNTYKIATTESGVMQIGVYGLDSNGKKCISSNLVCIEVSPGAYTGVKPLPKDIWDSYQITVLGYMERAEGAATEARLSANNAATSESNAKASEEAAKAAEKNIKGLSATATEGDTVSVTQTMADEGIRLDFTLPRGDKGVQGEQGIQGEQGPKGDKGADGYTPQKGIDYFDGQDGENGKNGTDGYTPIKGVDYFDGKDGKDGADGADGYTPVRGTDYWTEEDKAEIKAYVDEAILGGAW